MPEGYYVNLENLEGDIAISEWYRNPQEAFNRFSKLKSLIKPEPKWVWLVRTELTNQVLENKNVIRQTNF